MNPSLLVKITALLVLVSTNGAFAQKLDFSVKRGFYETSFQLSFSSDIPGATIRYTTDGSAPSVTTGNLYTSPLSISQTTVVRAIAYAIGIDTSKVHTHTYLFLSQVMHQPKTIPGWPAKTYGTGNGTAQMDYEMDPNIVNDPAYSASLVNGLKNIPSLSIVMDQTDFWSMYDDKPGDIEKPASIELMYQDETKNEQADCGIEAHSWKRLKRSMRLNFRSIYGTDKFVSDIFRNAPVGGATAAKEADHIILRAGNNRSWARDWNPNKTCYTRDEWYRATQAEIENGVGSHGTFVHLYVNGIYWGLYNPVERPDHKFASAYLGGKDDDWLSVSEGGVINGDTTRWAYLKNVLAYKDMTVPANYQELKQYLDVRQFCDYLILSWMVGKSDWPQNNWYAAHNNNPPDPLKYFAWDAEWSFDTTFGSSMGAWVHPQFRKNKTTGVTLVTLFNRAKKNPEFMTLFADRVYQLCFNDGPLTDDNSRKRWAKINSFIEDAIVAESARWGDALGDGITRTRNTHWVPEIRFVDSLMNGNVDRFITALRAEGYYPSVNPPVFSKQGGIVTNAFTLFVTNPNTSGVIYYTTDGTDPRDAAGAISPSAQLCNGSITIDGRYSMVARVKDGNSWSAKQEALFAVQLNGLSINEVLTSNTKTNVDESGEYDDWIEIYNTTDSPVNMAGLFLTDNLNNPGKYEVPGGYSSRTTVTGNGYVVFWADKQPAQGPMHVNFKLNSDAGEIGLYQIAGPDTLLIDALTYGAQKKDTSYGRYKDGASGLYYFSSPTPRASNDTLTIQAGIFSKSKEDVYWMNVYPNPFTQSVAIEFTSKDTEEVTIELYSTKGVFVQRIYEGNAAGGATQNIGLDLSHLESGAYVIKSASKDFSGSRLILKK